MSGNLKLNTPSAGSVTLSTADTASNVTVTIPAATDTATLNAQTQTLTNKTLVASGSNTVEATSGPTSTQLAGNRNRIINGAMQIWQRGTTFTASGYGPDRWLLQVAGTCTFTQETSVVPNGAQYALKWTTGAASSYGQVRQFLEQLNVIPLRGQTVTASAMVRLGPVFSGTLSWECAYNASIDTQGAGWNLITTSQTGTPTSTGYTKITATFTVPSNAVGLYIGIVPNAAQASGSYCYQTQIQLEPGASATPFENRLYGSELELCQRFYETSFPCGTAPDHSAPFNHLAIWPGVGSLGCGGNSYYLIPFKVPKRTTGGSFRFFDPNGTHPQSENWVRSWGGCGGGTANGPNPGLAFTNMGNYMEGYFQVGTAAVIGFDWTIDVEL